MAATAPRRREAIAYLAGLAVIAALMVVVALGGGVITARQPIIDLDQSRATAAR